MMYEYKELNKCEALEKRIITTCKFNNVKYEIKSGNIININNTNISFIEPHKIIIFIKNKHIILIYYNKENMFLYNRCLQIRCFYNGYWFFMV